MEDGCRAFFFFFRVFLSGRSGNVTRARGREVLGVSSSGSDSDEDSFSAPRSDLRGPCFASLLFAARFLLLTNLVALSDSNSGVPTLGRFFCKDKRYTK